MKKWIFFDLDGTLSDPVIGITTAVKYALSKFGIQVKYLKDLIPFIGPPLKESFMEFYGLSQEQAEEAIGYYREYYGPKGIFENEVYPGIEDLLYHLEEAGFDLAVASGKPTEYVDRILRYFGLREHFIVVIGSTFDGRRTDKAELIRYVLRRAQIRGDQAIMVGDRRHDIIGARECGVESIGVTYGYGSREELEQNGADHVVDSVTDLEQKIYEILQSEVSQSQILSNPMMKKNQKESHRFMNKKNERMSEAEIYGDAVRMAIAGTDAKAERFYQANRFEKQISFVAVYDESMERALEFAGRKRQLMCFDDAAELAEWDSVDAVYVSGIFSKRYDMIRTMLSGGKHVLAEAPLAQTVEEAEKLYALAQEKNVMLMEAIPTIHTPSFEKTLTYLPSLGKICHVTLQNCHALVGYEQWKRGIKRLDFDREASGGATMEAGVVPVATMIRLFGAPGTVHAAGVTLDGEIDVTGTILMGYDTMVGEVVYSQISESAMPSQIQGEEASMLVREIDNIKDLRISRRKVDQSVHFEQSDNIIGHVTNVFLHMIRTGIGMEEAKKLSVETLRVLEEAKRQIYSKAEEEK